MLPIKLTGSFYNVVLLYFRKHNGEECDSNEFLSLDSNISGKSTSSDNSASGVYLYIWYLTH